MAGPNKVGTCENGYCEVPGRTFTMGSPAWMRHPDESPPREVTLSTRWLRRTEVTIDEYKAFLTTQGPFDVQVVLSGCGSLDPVTVVVKGRPGESEPALLKRARAIAGRANCTLDQLKVDREPKQGMMRSGMCGEMNDRGGNHPIVCVNQQMAERFCAAEGATLPSEALIESASRGPSGKDDFGNPIETAAILDNLKKTLKPGERVGTQPVCGPDNEREGPFGVCDLAGNVLEKTGTKYDRDGYATMSSTDPDTPLTGETGEPVALRGGSIATGREQARAANRESDVLLGGYHVGFRCARPKP